MSKPKHTPGKKKIILWERFNNRLYKYEMTPQQLENFRFVDTWGGFYWKVGASTSGWLRRKDAIRAEINSLEDTIKDTKELLKHFKKLLSRYK